MIRQSLTESISSTSVANIFVESRFKRIGMFGGIDVNREMGIRQKRVNCNFFFQIDEIALDMKA